MISEAGFDQFICGFHQDVISLSQVEGEESFREDKFTELILEDLADAGEVDDFQICFHKHRKMKINGYSLALDEDRIDIFVSYYKGEFPPKKMSKSDVEKQFALPLSFFEKAINGYYRELEESSPVFDLAITIYENKDNIKKIGIFLLTDCISSVEYKLDEIFENYRVSYHIWDIQRFYRSRNSENRHGSIEIDFVEEFGNSIPCLPMPQQNPYYKIYVAFFSGKILANIYDKHGSKLIERNVRSFLQAKGNVNKEIRDTIKKEPEMFLAYNNGISVIAEEIEIEHSENSGCGIRKVVDFQIVNGCQTTASIYRAVSRDKEDISNIFVQVKLTVPAEKSYLDTIGPKISKYANSQNKINISDFSANDPFHINLEQLSRTIWTPPTRVVQHQTHWYYERTRGQYQEDKSRQKTPKLKKLFADHNPTAQRFTKTDLAKYENTWDQLPHIVSLGAQKNYSKFIIRLDEENKIHPDEEYFRKLISKAVIFKIADKLINQQKYGGYKANIVTYTLALISFLTLKRIDLEKIWKEQTISTSLEEFILEVSVHVHQHITNPPGGKNVTEWCKKEECWRNLLELKIEIPDSLKNELLNSSDSKVNFETTLRSTEIGDDLISLQRKDEIYSEEDIDSEEPPKIGSEDQEINLEEFFQKQSPLKWFEISKWAQESGSFSDEQIDLLKRIGKLRGRNVKLKQTQINQVQEIIKSLHTQGYEIGI